MIPHLTVRVLNEAGFKEAMLGLSLNKDQPIENMPKVAAKLAPLDLGHSKFLEQMIIWLEVRAPRYWWQEASTYRLSSTSSQSTMHTALKHSLEESDFEDFINPKYLETLNNYVTTKDLLKLKTMLPEGFLQKRMWMMSYKTLRNIILQRYHHRLPHWKIFCDQIKRQVDHPEFLPFEELEKNKEIQNDQE